MKKGFHVYAAAGQLAFIVAAPLLAFIWGGGWAADHFGLSPHMKSVFALVGVAVMICSLISWFHRLIVLYGNTDKDKRYYSRKEVDLDDD